MAGRGGKDGSRKSNDDGVDLGQAIIVLTKSVEGMQKQLSGLSQRVTDLDTKLDNVLSEAADAAVQRVEDRFRPLIEDLRRDIDDAVIKQIQTEQDVNERLEYIERDIREIKTKLTSVCEPFNPSTSVILFGVTYKTDEDIEHKVEDIMVGALCVDVNVVAVERLASRNGKPGAVKVELGSIYEKMAVLRAKQKLNGHKKYDKVRVRSCESHSDRVNRINTGELLKLMGRDEEFVIVGNGLLKSKAALKEQAKARVVSGPGGSAQESTGDAANDDDTSGSEESDQDSEDESTRGSVSDNGGDRHQNKHGRRNPKETPTNHSSPPVTTKKSDKKPKTPEHEVRRQPSRSGRGMSSSSRGGGSLTNISQSEQTALKTPAATDDKKKKKKHKH